MLSPSEQHVLATGLLLAGMMLSTADSSASQRAPITEIEWSAQAVVLDVDCDERPDSATLGNSPGRVYVRVTLAASGNATILEFPVDPSQQAAVCTDTVTLEPEDLAYDPAESVGDLEGYARSTTCSGLRLVDDACDSIHIYWNHLKGRLDWWRL